MGGVVPRRPGGGGGPTERCSGAPLRGYHHHGPAVEPHTQPVQTAPPTAMSSDTSASTRQQPQAAGGGRGGRGGGMLAGHTREVWGQWLLQPYFRFGKLVNLFFLGYVNPGERPVCTFFFCLNGGGGEGGTLCWGMWSVWIQALKLFRISRPNVFTGGGQCKPLASARIYGFSHNV